MANFLRILGTMSGQAVIIILVVFVLRKLFEKLHISKKYCMLLWMVPFFCLVCPWKVSTPHGFWREIPTEVIVERLEENKGISSIKESSFGEVEKQDVQVNNQAVAYQGQTSQEQAAQNQDTQNPNTQNRTSDIKSTFIGILGTVWGMGVLGLLIYNNIRYWSLRKRLLCSMEIDKNIYVGDEVVTPMVIGIFRPRIYIPTGMSKEQEKYVLAHETTHVRRLDGIYKLVVYIITCAHWFNPIVWLGFYFFCKDMEMACDEETVHLLGMEEKQAYAKALLDAASGNMRRTRMLFVAPIAFEEGNVKDRIKNIMKYKKSVTVVAVCSVLICILVAGIFLTKEKTVQEEKTKTEEMDRKEKPLTSKEDIEAYYMEFIKKVVVGLGENFQSVSTEELGICDVFNNGIQEGNQVLGFCMTDLDSDGVEELLIGAYSVYQDERWSSNKIYDIYTIQDGEMLRVTNGGYNNVYYLCDNGMIANEWVSNGCSCYDYNIYKDGELQLVEGATDLNMKEEEIDAIRDKYQYVLPNLTPFSRVELVEE